MSVVSVEEQVKEQEASVDGEVITAIRRFFVQIDAPASDGAMQAVLAAALPAYRAKFPSGFGSYVVPTVRTKTAQPLDDNSRTLYAVTVNYSNEAPDPELIRNAEDTETLPWEEDPQFTYDVAEYPVAMENDFADTPVAVLNSVGDPFDPPVESVVSRRRIVVTYNDQNNNAASCSPYVNTVNQNAKTINGEAFAAQTLRLIRWTSQPAVYTEPDGTSSVTYYQVTVEFEHNPDTWDLSVRDQGYRVRPSVGADPVLAVDADGQPKATPTLLNADGTEASASSPHYITFKPYVRSDWAALNI